MDDAASPLPELSQLLHKATRAAAAIDALPDGPLVAEHRRVLVDLIGFIREYDVTILDRLGE